MGRRVYSRATIRGKITSKKFSFKINYLHERRNHICVLFVQHHFKNSLSPSLPSGSFVACAWSFGNCGVATEGGIPRSSR